MKRELSQDEQLGKKVAGQQYFHIDALSTFNPNIAEAVEAIMCAGYL